MQELSYTVLNIYKSLYDTYGNKDDFNLFVKDDVITLNIGNNEYNNHEIGKDILDFVEIAKSSSLEEFEAVTFYRPTALDKPLMVVTIDDEEYPYNLSVFPEVAELYGVTSCDRNQIIADFYKKFEEEIAPICKENYGFGLYRYGFGFKYTHSNVTISILDDTSIDGYLEVGLLNYDISTDTLELVGISSDILPLTPFAHIKDILIKPFIKLCESFGASKITIEPVCDDLCIFSGIIGDNRYEYQVLSRDYLDMLTRDDVANQITYLKEINDEPYLPSKEIAKRMDDILVEYLRSLYEELGTLDSVFWNAQRSDGGELEISLGYKGNVATIDDYDAETISQTRLNEISELPSPFKELNYINSTTYNRFMGIMVANGTGDFKINFNKEKQEAILSDEDIILPKSVKFWNDVASQ
jgi:hypothetical protein